MRTPRVHSARRRAFILLYFSLYLSLSYIVSSMMALTISPSLAFNAAAAFPLLTFACVATRSTSSSKPLHIDFAFIDFLRNRGNLRRSRRSTSRRRRGTIRRFSFKRGCLRGRFCRHVFRFCFAEDDARIPFGALKQSGFEMTYNKFPPLRKVTLSTFSTFSCSTWTSLFSPSFPLARWNLGRDREKKRRERNVSALLDATHLYNKRNKKREKTHFFVVFRLKSD